MSMFGVSVAVTNNLPFFFKNTGTSYKNILLLKASSNFVTLLSDMATVY